MKKILITILALGIVLFLIIRIFFLLNHVKVLSDSKEVYNILEKENNISSNNKFSKIKIYYDYESIVPFSGTYDEEPDMAFEIDVTGDDLTALQNILKKSEIETEKNKIEDTGHYHGTTFYSNIFTIPAEYRVEFADGTEMLINDIDFEAQYKNKKNYYMYDNNEFIEEVIRIVNDEIYKNPVELNTSKITITGQVSGKVLDITDSNLIKEIINEYRYYKDSTVDKDLIESLLDYETDDYIHKRKDPNELEYKIDFNNGEKLKIILRNGNIGYFINDKDEYEQGLTMNPKFISMIYDIMDENLTDEEKEKIIDKF